MIIAYITFLWKLDLVKDLLCWIVYLCVLLLFARKFWMTSSNKIFEHNWFYTIFDFDLKCQQYKGVVNPSTLPRITPIGINNRKLCIEILTWPTWSSLVIGNVSLGSMLYSPFINPHPNFAIWREKLSSWAERK